jgi:hypothetical protein
MDHTTTWEEDYKGNNTSPSLQSPLANSSTPSCTYWLISWMVFTASLDALAKKSILACAGYRTPVTVLTDLSRFLGSTGPFIHGVITNSDLSMPVLLIWRGLCNCLLCLIRWYLGPVPYVDENATDWTYNRTSWCVVSTPVSYVPGWNLGPDDFVLYSDKRVHLCLNVCFWTKSVINPLRPSGNYMNHLLWKSVMLYFVFIGFAWFSL